MTEYSSFLENTFLFKGMSTDTIQELISKVQIEKRTFERNDTIYSPEQYKRKVGFVISGECIVGRETGGTFVPINTLEETDSFGILTVFSKQEEFPTLIKAKNLCSILFFNADDVLRIVEESSEVSMNVINFMTAKIIFLNNRIAEFSGGCIEEKLASYLIGLVKKTNSTEFDFNKKRSAEALNCGRASLYRAINIFESRGYISFVNKKIHINDIKGLERILK